MSRKIRFSDPVRRLAGAFAVIALLFAALQPAASQAQSLDALRAAGTVGERYDGYLVLRDSGAPSSVKSLVSSTNAQRKALYDQRAREEKVPVDAIGRIYAGQIMQKAPKGTYFLDQSGKWTRQ